MATNIETKRRLRAIRRLSASFPDRTADERLEKIAGIAKGDLDPADFRHQTSPDLIERIKRGQASKSVRNALDTRAKLNQDEPEAESEDEPEKRRKRRGSRDRKEGGGFDRSADLNG